MMDLGASWPTPSSPRPTEKGMSTSTMMRPGPSGTTRVGAGAPLSGGALSRPRSRARALRPLGSSRIAGLSPSSRHGSPAGGGTRVWPRARAAAHDSCEGPDVPLLHLPLPTEPQPRRPQGHPAAVRPASASSHVQASGPGPWHGGGHQRDRAAGGEALLPLPTAASAAPTWAPPNPSLSPQPDAPPDACQVSFDAAATIRGELFFFKAGFVWRLRGGRLQPGYPALASRHWQGLPSPVDAAFEDAQGHIWFFQGEWEPGHTQETAGSQERHGQG